MTRDFISRRLGATLAHIETAPLPDVYSYLTARRRATPRWADAAAIERVYKTAADFGLHVDHIIPLQGRRVSGLHVANNLQLLTPRENAAKGNAFNPDAAI